MIGNAAGHGTHDLEGVERGNTRAALGSLNSRKRYVETVRCRSGRESQHESFVFSAIRLSRQFASEFPAEIVQEQRIFTQLLRKQAFGESRYEHDTERAAANLIGTANENAAVTMRRRFDFQRPKAIGKHVSNFCETHGSYGSHWPKIGKNAQH